MNEIETGPQASVETMIAQLLDTGLLGDSDKADLAGYGADWEAGRLEPDDLQYLTALHARLVLGREAGAVEESDPALEVESWRERAERAEAEVARLSDLLARHGIEASPEEDGPAPTGR